MKGCNLHQLLTAVPRGIGKRRRGQLDDEDRWSVISASRRSLAPRPSRAVPLGPAPHTSQLAVSSNTAGGFQTASIPSSDRSWSGGKQKQATSRAAGPAGASLPATRLLLHRWTTLRRLRCVSRPVTPSPPAAAPSSNSTPGESAIGRRTYPNDRKCPRRATKLRRLQLP